LIAPAEAERGSRLALAAVTLKQLETALRLLGIETPDQM
jgi:arginyl-tRNA synthetase